MSLGSLSKNLPSATLTLPTGSIDLLDTTVIREAPPVVQEDDIYKTPTTQIGPVPTKNEILIMSNYVKVTSIPKTLWVYSLRFWRPHPQASSKVIEFNKKREIGCAFNALLHSGVLSLGKEQKHWATNFKELWSSVRLAEHRDGEEEWVSPSFAYTQLSGKIISDMQVTIHFIKTFDDIDKSMRTEDITDLSDCIRALNAHVSQSALAHADEGRLTQVGANKFYLNGSHEILNPNAPDGLMALRGYYTSIRPTKTGALLNVNTATSAFLPPVTVSRFVKAMGKTEAERLLKGSMVRIAYRRKANDEKDMNCEEARCKVFQHFGLLAYQQKFYRVLEKDKKNKNSKRRVDPKDIGRTVAQYLTNEALVDLGPFSGDELLCVNVGKKVENLDTANETKMRKQTLDGAIWIPACLLEILPNQAVHGLLSADNTAQMIKQAVRLPAANAGRIVQEGLEVLGVVSRPGQPENSQLASHPSCVR
jgi:eukaryotic translation initiation factor 2C